MARGDGDGAPAGPEDVGHDDVWSGRDDGRPHRALVPRAAGPGAHRRLHGVHLLATATGAHRAPAPAEDRCGHLLTHSGDRAQDRKSTRLNSSHRTISYDVFCLKKKKIYLDCQVLTTSTENSSTSLMKRIGI